MFLSSFGPLRENFLFNTPWNESVIHIILETSQHVTLLDHLKALTKECVRGIVSVGRFYTIKCWCHCFEVNEVMSFWNVVWLG